MGWGGEGGAESASKRAPSCQFLEFKNKCLTAGAYVENQVCTRVSERSLRDFPGSVCAGVIDKQARRGDSRAEESHNPVCSSHPSAPVLARTCAVRHGSECLARGRHPQLRSDTRTHTCMVPGLPPSLAPQVRMMLGLPPTNRWRKGRSGRGNRCEGGASGRWSRRPMWDDLKSPSLILLAARSLEASGIWVMI